MQIYIELEASQVEKVDKHIKVAHGQLYDVSCNTKNHVFNGCSEIVLIIDFHMNVKRELRGIYQLRNCVHVEKIVILDSM
jgi:hypothetical protein